MSPRLDALVRHLHDGEGAPTKEDIVRILDLAPGEDIAILEIEALNAETGVGSYAVVPIAEAELWSREPANDATSDVPGLLREEHEEDRHLVMEEMTAKLSDTIGNASLQAFLRELAGALDWACSNYDPAKGTFIDFARAIARMAWRRTHEATTWSALGREKADQDRRVAAARDDDALAAYMAYVRDETIAWMASVRRKPREWVRDDARCQDQVYAVVLRMLELLRTADPMASFQPYERVGLPAFYQVRDEVIGQLRRKARVFAFEIPTTIVHASIPRPDQALLEQEIRRNIGDSIGEFLRKQISARQTKYLDALLIELELDDRVWGLQERIRDRVGRGKSRVSEALAKIRAVAESADMAELIRDASITGPPGAEPSD